MSEGAVEGGDAEVDEGIDVDGGVAVVFEFGVAGGEEAIAAVTFVAGSLHEGASELLDQREVFPTDGEEGRRRQGCTGLDGGDAVTQMAGVEGHAGEGGGDALGLALLLSLKAAGDGDEVDGGRGGGIGGWTSGVEAVDVGVLVAFGRARAGACAAASSWWLCLSGREMLIGRHRDTIDAKFLPSVRTKVRLVIYQMANLQDWSGSD